MATEATHLSLEECISRIISIVLFFLYASTTIAQPFNDLVNYKSGISLELSGTNGTDWAIEQTYHDNHIGDQIVYLKSSTQISLAHNANNTFVNSYSPTHIIGIHGIDAVANSGDEGTIHYKIDRDQQAHDYTGTSMPAWAPIYATPFSLNTLQHDASTPVMGTIGSNNGAWGDKPSNNYDRGYLGCLDAAGNEWHTLTYWDDDIAALTMHSINVHRQGSSDGHYVSLCVNPVTPIIQLKATTPAEFYTTPAKTYHIPRIWAQTSYVTAGVQLHFINLTNSETIYYAIDRGAYIPYNSTPLLSDALFNTAQTTYTLSVKNGTNGTPLTRTIVYDPSYPASSEQHGNLMWGTTTELNNIKNKVKNFEPFKTSYTTFTGSYYQGSSITYTDARGKWCSTSDMAKQTLQNAFMAVIEEPSNALAIATLAKTRLIRLARLQPVGSEADINKHSPAKDFMNELGQSMGDFMDVAIAYDLLAAHFRKSDHADGITPIEEYLIRDGLAKITTTIIGRMRDNNVADIGGGTTHWSHGYEKVIGTMALAMPTYNTSYYGTSGGDFTSTNTPTGSDGYYWNPYMSSGLTWYDIATDPLQETSGFPNARFPVRSDFLITDNGYWSGPNDLEGDGDRYYTGPEGKRLVDIIYGGLANANCRVELIEMSGYESPFATWTYIFELARRIKNDPGTIQSEQRYIQRRLVNGYTPLAWDAPSLTYTRQEPRFLNSLCAFNKYFEYAGLPTAKAGVDTFLNRLNIYYGKTSGTLSPEMTTLLSNDRKIFFNAYALAACSRPAAITDITPSSLPALPPVIKPLMKYVVQPGETIRKDIIAHGMHGEPLTISVTGLPTGATYSNATQRISWNPQSGNEGVYIVTVQASNGTYTTTRPFPIIVKTNLMAPIPNKPLNLTATIGTDNTAVQLSWNAPLGGTSNVSCYFLYRDGAFITTIGAHETTYLDNEFIPEHTHIRYHISAMYTNGSESKETATDPGYITIPSQSSPINPPISSQYFGTIHVYPSPFKSTVRITFPTATINTVASIYTQNGTLIRHISATKTFFAWDGTDTNGKAVTNGVYYCRMTDGVHTHQVKLIKMK